MIGQQLLAEYREKQEEEDRRQVAFEHEARERALERLIVKVNDLLAGRGRVDVVDAHFPLYGELQPVVQVDDLSFTFDDGWRNWREHVALLKIEPCGHHMTYIVRKFDDIATGLDYFARNPHQCATPEPAPGAYHPAFKPPLQDTVAQVVNILYALDDGDDLDAEREYKEMLLDIKAQIERRLVLGSW